MKLLREERLGLLHLRGSELVADGLTKPLLGQAFAAFLRDLGMPRQHENEEGEEWDFNEGCLSIPEVREDVKRKPAITISYVDEDFNPHRENYSGLLARVIQHEYDHIEGILFTDKLSSLKKRLLKSRLEKISKGKIKVDYKMRFPNLKKAR